MDKVAIMFPGQGSQYIGMGKSLCDEFTIAREVFDEANDVLGYDLKKICFEGGLSKLNSVGNMLPAILTASVAAFRVYLREVGKIPCIMAGHSLGEYSALTCSEMLTFSQALKLVRLRSELAVEVAEKQDGTMTIFEKVDRETIERECVKASKEGQIASVSCYNSDTQFAISGHRDAVMRAEDNLLEICALVTPLMNGAPFHSMLMKDASEKLKAELEKYSYKKPVWPVMSNVTAKPYEGPEAVVKNLVDQLMQPVRWVEIMDYFRAYGVEAAIEIGPQSVLKNLLEDDNKKMKAYSFNQKADKDILQDMLGKTDVGNVSTVVTRCLAMGVSTRNRNFDENEYQKGVIDPYRRIKEIQKVLDINGAYPDVDQMQEALELLHLIFVTKKLPLEEQIRRFNRILDQTSTKHLFQDFIKEKYNV